MSDPANHSTYIRSALLAWLAGIAFPAAPGGLYVGAFSTITGPAATGNNVTTIIRPTGRPSFTLGPAFDDSLGRARQNNTAADFEASAGAASFEHHGIFDAVSAGNLLYHGELEEALAVVQGDPVDIPINGLKLGIGGAWSAYVRDWFLAWLSGSAAPAAPAALYLALYSGDPGINGLGPEVTTAIRSAGRVAMSLGSETVTPDYVERSNNAVIDYGASENNATISDYGIFDSPEDGNFLWGGGLKKSRSVSQGTPVRYPINRLKLRAA